MYDGYRIVAGNYGVRAFSTMANCHEAWRGPGRIMANQVRNEPETNTEGTTNVTSSSQQVLRIGPEVLQLLNRIG